MSLKAMAFIDGAWLYKSRNALFEKLGMESGCEIDYAKLPSLICEQVAKTAGEDVGLVRTHYFGAVPAARPGHAPSKQGSFYDFLERSCGYETDIAEMPVGCDSHAEESWIRMALGASMLFNAMLPTAYDVAILFGDNICYGPMLSKVRMLGKRIQIVSAHTSDGTSPLLGSPQVGKQRFFDFQPLFIDDYADQIRLVRELVMRICKKCGSDEQTTWAGPDFFCSKCRGKHRGTDDTVIRISTATPRQ